MPARKFVKRPVKKSYKKSYKKYSSNLRKNVATMIKKISLKNNETKYTEFNQDNQNLYHNGGATPIYSVYGNILTTSQGTTQLTRVGDSVVARGISIRLWLSNKLDRPNVMYRVFLFTCPPTDYAASAPSNLFQGAIGNKMIDYINSDKYKILYHKIIKPFAGDYSLESGATNKEHSTYLNIYIPLKNRSVKYTTNGGTLPTYQGNIINLGIVAYDAYGSLTTDNIASYHMVGRFYFKDP